MNDQLTNYDGQPIIVPLAQLKPANGILTDLYTVPKGGHALIQKIIFTNMHTTQKEKVSLALAQKGAPPDDKQFFYLQDYSIDANNFITLEPQVTLDQFDVLRVQTQGNAVVGLLGHLT